MLTPGMTIAHEANGTVRRPPSILLPDDPSQEVLLQFWTLSAQDRDEVLRCRGDANRRRFAVQLCMLRTYGRFLPEAPPTPVAITNHLARPLDLPLGLFGALPGRLATETDQLQRIRHYLGWRPFDHDARARGTQWLTQRATDDLLPSELLSRAEDILRSWRIALPARSTLEALVASITTRVQDGIHSRIADPLAPELRQALDDLLEVPSGERRSALFDLKESPPEASNAVMLRYIERYHLLRDLGIGTIDLSRVSPPMVRYFADIAKRYDVAALRRFAPTKRYALMACFVVEIHKTILDHIVALHDQLLSKKMREARNVFEQRYRQLRRPYRRGLKTLITTGKTLLDPDRPPETTLAMLLQDLDETVLRDAVEVCEERHYLEERGEIDALRARYPGLRRYLPAFYTLPFQGEPGSEAIITGLDSVRQVDTETLKTFPAYTPTAFMPGKFRAALHNQDGTLDRRTWELGLAGAVRDGLRSGDVYLPESRRHVSFANLVYEPARWQHERDDAYTELQLPQAPDDFCARLQRAFDAVAQQAERGLPDKAVCHDSTRPFASQKARCT
jgi:Domain of unknown function (DUF4158)